MADATFCAEKALAVRSSYAMDNQGSSSNGSSTIPYSLQYAYNVHVMRDLTVDRGIHRPQGECIFPLLLIMCQVGCVNI